MTFSGPRSKRVFPWEEALHFGLGVLRWTPHEFWRATPMELAAAARALTGSGGTASEAPLSRARFEELAARFPDTLQGAPDD